MVVGVARLALRRTQFGRQDLVAIILNVYALVAVVLLPQVFDRVLFMLGAGAAILVPLVLFNHALEAWDLGPHFRRFSDYLAIRLGSGFDLGVYLATYLLVVFGAVCVMSLALYQDYGIRSDVRTGVRNTDPVKRAVAEALEKPGPHDMSQRGAAAWTPPPSGGVRSMSVERGGAITLAYTGLPAGLDQIQIVPVADGRRIDLSEAASKGKVFQWQCAGPEGNTTVPAKFLPSYCKGPSGAEAPAYSNAWWRDETKLLGVLVLWPLCLFLIDIAFRLAALVRKKDR
jgi:hypothetical protein